MPQKLKLWRMLKMAPAKHDEEIIDVDPASEYDKIMVGDDND